MKTITLKNLQIKQLSELCNVPEKLIRATARQFGGWDSLKESAHDITRCGAAAGFSGFCYYYDTLPFYARNQALIVGFAKDWAHELGEGIIEMVAGFNCLKQGGTTSDEVGATLYGTKRQHDTYTANALSWFALEEVARAIDDAIENQ